MKDRRKRTAWIPRTTKPVYHGVYECSVMLTSCAPNFLWELEWDGVGFKVPCPMVVHAWRGLAKKPKVS